MAIKTANKANISITWGKSTKIGLNETKRNKVLFIGKLYESNCILFCTKYVRASKFSLYSDNGEAEEESWTTNWFLAKRMPRNNKHLAKSWFFQVQIVLLTIIIVVLVPRTRIFKWPISQNLRAHKKKSQVKFQENANCREVCISF